MKQCCEKYLNEQFAGDADEADVADGQQLKFQFILFFALLTGTSALFGETGPQRGNARHDPDFTSGFSNLNRSGKQKASHMPRVTSRTIGLAMVSRFCQPISESFGNSIAVADIVTMITIIVRLTTIIDILRIIAAVFISV